MVYGSGTPQASGLKWSACAKRRAILGSHGQDGFFWTFDDSNEILVENQYVDALCGDTSRKEREKWGTPVSRVQHHPPYGTSVAASNTTFESLGRVMLCTTFAEFSASL